MSAPPETEAVKQIRYLTAPLKAPRITDAAVRLADQARRCGMVVRGLPRSRAGAGSVRPQRLRRGVADRSGRLPGPQDPRRLDWDVQPTQRQTVAALASGRFLTRPAIPQDKRPYQFERKDALRDIRHKDALRAASTLFECS